jgi:hypothetical protein
MTKNEHKNIGIKFFNATWDLIDKQDRTPEDDLKMIQSSHASLHHWRLGGGTPLNLARGEWQISHVYAILGMGEAALNHALSYKKLIEDNNIKDFDLVFVYEALAYAYKLLDMKQEYKTALDTGFTLISQCEKDDDKKYCYSQLESLKQMK